MSLQLIIINGMPGTGKTTIAKPLAEKLGLPLIAKDTIKEFLFDMVGVGDREWSKMLGKATSEFLYSLTDAMLSNNHSVVIESAFEKQFALPAIQAMIDAYTPEIIEIYCQTGQAIRRQRFYERNESGLRHVGHTDLANYLTDDQPEPLEKYAPIGLGNLLTIDTTNTAIDIDDLAKSISA